MGGEAEGGAASGAVSGGAEGGAASGAASGTTGGAAGGEAELAVIRVAAALIVDDDGRLLLVRKRGTSVFMQPGGKYEPGESGAQTLARELQEELGVAVDPAALAPLGTFTARAANEAGQLVEAEVFRVALAEADPPPVARAEIAELRWIHPDDLHRQPVAPLVTDRMLALLDVP
jgi:8-oxo-dGTP pyrophosphatase MutT (NUDIX family)